MATGGKLAHAPMDHDPEYVMDVATGTGIWAIQFGSTVQNYWATFRKGMSKIGRDMLCPRNYKTWLAEVGFVDIREQIFHCPLADWPEELDQKRLGQYALVNLTEGARGFSWKALGFAGLGAEEKENLTAELRRDAGDPSLEIFHPVYVVYARKPHDWEVEKTQGQSGSDS
ncbi:hypothetical protein PG994_002814 [Apiospora phragmitis]|uniref:Methyltransferase n=1 Tax=Apiospora phragmitis TaxID=2905665 RepID=A0ABR1W679_9PEZI